MKNPVSVLVLIHTPALDILLLERKLHRGYWQSVTGSLDDGETLADTACREVREETGIEAERFDLKRWNLSNRFEIFAEWRHRYDAGVTHNVEHVFSLELPSRLDVVVAPDEHLDYLWLPWRDAVDRVFSWTNRDAIITLALMRQAT